MGRPKGQKKKEIPVPAGDLTEQFARLRSGAANVAGVTLQVSLSAMLLSAGRAGDVPGLPVGAVCPEGFEDVDCHLADGSRLFVQSKARGPGAQNIAAAELAEIMAHATQTIWLSDQATVLQREQQSTGAGEVAAGTDAPVLARLAVVTNGRFGSSLPHTGWTGTLDTALASRATTRTTLLTALKKQLSTLGLDPALAPMTLSRTHLIEVCEDLGQATTSMLQNGLGLHPSMAALLRSRLQCDLADVAAAQQHSAFAEAVVRTTSDLDAMTAVLGREIDVDSLEEAVAAGVCEPLDFLAPSPQDARGFFEGISVLPSHIAAGLDVLRPQESQQVLDGLSARGQAIISGPSGSGKSALLWRCARLIEAGPRLLRVLRVATSYDAELLVRHVMRAKPSRQCRVVVCVDDLGRARTASWIEARDRLLEMPGVAIMAAGRREDLTPALTRGAALVDAALTPTAAEQVYHAVQDSGVPLVMAREEAVKQADGLLMEFLALATTGRRLREVLAEQVDALAVPQRRLDRSVLRLVCAAHALGFEVPTDTLPTALGQDPDALEEVFHRLVGEHLVTNTEGNGWKGLHDLRTEVLLDLLHTNALPTLASTYATAITALAAPARPQALRRAAVRVAKTTVQDLDTLTASERLTRTHHALHPLAQCIAEQLRHTAAAGSDAVGDVAVHAAGLLEAADRIDSVAHVYAALPLVEQERPPGIDAATLLWIAWMSPEMDLDLPQFEPVKALGKQLPARTEDTALAAGRALGPVALLSLVCGTQLATAVRLCEAAEGLITFSPAQAGTAYRHHVPVLPDPPGSGTSVAADLRAQLTASLTVLADLRGADVAAVFGDVTRRAVDAVASDPFGCSVDVAFLPSAALGPDTTGLALPWTYAGDLACSVRAISYARPDGSPAVPTAYAPEPGGDQASENGQIIVLMRRLFDACPEADLVDAELWHAHNQPRRVVGITEGVKRLRAGALRRARATSRNVALQAAAMESAGSGTWTERCRAQALLATDLLALLAKIPARLRPKDSAPARQEWTARVERAHQAAVALPARPAEPAPLLAAADAVSMSYTAAQEDAALREAPQLDVAKKAFTAIASSLRQVSHAQANTQALRGAGARLSDALPDLRRAIDQGSPLLSGIGDTLPPALVTAVTDAARLLSAVDEPPVATALRHGTQDSDRLRTAVHASMQAVLDASLQAVTTLLANAGVSVANFAVLADSAPAAPWRDRQLALNVTLEQWPTALETIRSWAPEAREAAGMRCRIVLVPIEDGEVLPMGIHINDFGQPLPLLEEHLGTLADALGAPLRGNDTQADLQQPAEQLRAYSYALVRRANRTPGWTSDPTSPPAPDAIADTFARTHADVLAHLANAEALPYSGQCQLIAALALIELCGLVAHEDGRQPGLAAGMADIDITHPIIPEGNEASAKLNFALTAAIEADRGSRQTPQAG
ncbi:hypothetical protein ACFZCK_22720 [Kitasatospora purpeofusca]|uniref:hypothetical protein n=1 Tax=Kitasatospora purpeofusca TaxID=67352 RepID=UPI0036EC5B1C